MFAEFGLGEHAGPVIVIGVVGSMIRSTVKKTTNETARNAAVFGLKELRRCMPR